jgi:maltooligosyltrehalose trehalohydrolase
MQAQLPDPADPATFERSKLDFAEREGHAEMYALHQDLLGLRRQDPVLRSQPPRRSCSATSTATMAIVWFS